jgi:hypothetical protein
MGQVLPKAFHKQRVTGQALPKALHKPRVAGQALPTALHKQRVAGQALPKAFHKQRVAGQAFRLIQEKNLDSICLPSRLPPEIENHQSIAKSQPRSSIILSEGPFIAEYGLYN